MFITPPYEIIKMHILIKLLPVIISIPLISGCVSQKKSPEQYTYREIIDASNDCSYQVKKIPGNGSGKYHTIYLTEDNTINLINTTSQTTPPKPIQYYESSVRDGKSPGGVWMNCMREKKLMFQ
ncbi:hypothetical protein VP018_000135 [Morganella morganii]|nr:hypothetical protein [Morganella morganii]